ncbi:hypothetical protein D3C71_2183180 [compost metagenome]
MNHLCRSGEQPAEHRHAGGYIRQVDQYGNELVATNSRQGVTLAQRLLHARRQGDQ